MPRLTHPATRQSSEIRKQKLVLRRLLYIRKHLRSLQDSAHQRDAMTLDSSALLNLAIAEDHVTTTIVSYGGS